MPQNNYLEITENRSRFWDCDMFFRAFVIEGVIYELQMIDGVVKWVSIKTVIDNNTQNNLTNKGEIRPLAELLELKRIVLEHISIATKDENKI